MIEKGCYILTPHVDHHQILLKYNGSRQCIIAEDFPCYKSIKTCPIDCDDAFDYMYMWSSYKAKTNKDYKYTEITEERFNWELLQVYGKIVKEMQK